MSNKTQSQFFEFQTKYRNAFGDDFTAMVEGFIRDKAEDSVIIDEIGKKYGFAVDEKYTKNEMREMINKIRRGDSLTSTCLSKLAGFIWNGELFIKEH
jgi:hypothetical protein